MLTKKNLEIEYLRAIAIAMTMLGHVPTLLPFFSSRFEALFSIYRPWGGVDLFFCISGYVVSRSYMELMDRHVQEGSFWIAAQSFWVRRIYRLLPTSWLWIFIPLLLSIFFNKSGMFGSWYDNVRSFTAVATFSGNVANIFGFTLGPNSVYWSLALEEQFYFLFPVFLLFVRSNSIRINLLIIFIIIQFFVNRDPFGTQATGLAWSLRLDPMMWGILIYLFSRSAVYKQFEPTFLKGSKLKSSIITLLLVYLLGAIAGQMIATPVAVGLIAIVSALLLFMASFNAGYIPYIPVISAVLEWMGSRSYGMYVIHFPAYRLAGEIWYRVAESRGVSVDSSFTPQLLGTAIFFIVVLCELNYRFVEQPLRRKGAIIAAQRLETNKAVTPANGVV